MNQGKGTFVARVYGDLNDPLSPAQRGTTMAVAADGHTYGDDELAQISSQENRLLLTRDRGLLKHKIVVYGHCVRSSKPRQQLIDILRR